jgi:hypothetical protein
MSKLTDKMDKMLLSHKALVIVILVAIALLMFASLTEAQQDHTCQGGHNCNGGGDGQGQQTQSQSSSSAIENINSTESRSGADSNSRSSANSGGNHLSNSAGGGESTSDSSATGGNATAASGVGGDSNVRVEGDQYTASSAATVFAGHCQTGMSGQLEAGGFGVVNSDQFCDYIRLAAVMREAYEYELAECECVGVCTSTLASVEMSCPAGGEKARIYLEAYHLNLSNAQELVVSSEYTAMADRWGGQLLRPTAIILALIWIL